MKKIVIIGDCAGKATLYRGTLEAEGFEVHVDADGEGGLSTIERLEPDLVLLDLALPRMSGVEVLARLRESDRSRKLPVVVLSDADQPSWLEHALEAGATQALPETVRPENVAEIACSLLPLGTDRVPGGASMGRILIVDDDSILRSIFTHLLSRIGYQVDAASDGQEALSKANAHEPDLIVLDMLMPKMDGIEFLRAYDVIKTHPKVKVITFSISDEPQTVKEALALGVIGYMTKSQLSPRGMVQVIEDTLARDKT